MKSKSFIIIGMTCTSCAKAIERAVNKIEGIESVSVNFATETASIKYDHEKVRLSNIKQTITKAGYKPLEVEKNQSVNHEKERREKEIKTLWNKFLISAIFSLPLLYVAMGHMMGLPLPSILVGDENASNFAWTQLLLTLPVIIAGYKFYVVGFKSLFKGSPNMDSLIALGTSAAILYGIFAVYKIMTGTIEEVKLYSHDLYFETAGVIITLILLGKYLESVAKGRISEAIKKLMGLAPKTAIIIQDGKEIEISIEDVQVGDIILVKPGQKIPVDGKVVHGSTGIQSTDCQVG